MTLKAMTQAIKSYAPWISWGIGSTVFVGSVLVDPNGTADVLTLIFDFIIANKVALLWLIDVLTLIFDFIIANKVVLWLIVAAMVCWLLYQSAADIEAESDEHEQTDGVDVYHIQPDDPFKRIGQVADEHDLTDTEIIAAFEIGVYALQKIHGTK